MPGNEFNPQLTSELRVFVINKKGTLKHTFACVSGPLFDNRKTITRLAAEFFLQVFAQNFSELGRCRLQAADIFGQQGVIIIDFKTLDR